MKDLLLLHGALGAAVQFDPLRPFLEGDFRVHAFNFSGHGGRPFAEQFGTVRFAEEVLAFLDEQDIARADIFGYSMGGYVALAFTRLYPGRAGRLFTLATKFDWTPETAAREAAMLDADRLLARVPHFAETLRRRHAPNDWRELLEATVEMMLDLGDRPLLTPAVLGTIEHPAAIAVGAADDMVSLEETAAAAAAMARGRLIVLPGTPHPLEKVDPALLSKHLCDFFS